MKPYNGYKAEKPASAREHLPAGGYVAKILNAEELEYSWGRVLLISFDIADGGGSGSHGGTGAGSHGKRPFLRNVFPVPAL